MLVCLCMGHVFVFAVVFFLFRVVGIFFLLGLMMDSNLHPTETLFSCHPEMDAVCRVEVVAGYKFQIFSIFGDLVGHTSVASYAVPNFSPHFTCFRPTDFSLVPTG